MDRIVLTEDQFQKLLEETVHAMVHTDKEMHISIPSFTLVLEGTHVRVTYRQKDNALIITYIDISTNTKAEFGTAIPNYSWKQITIPTEVMFDRKSDKRIKDFLTMQVPKLGFIEREGPSYNYQHIYLTYEIIQKSLLCLPTIWRKNKEDPSKKPLANGKTQRRTALLRNTYVYNSQYVPFRNYETYTCECWGVRGHIRHLKDGREIFIKPYKKGIKRNSIDEGKDYKYGKRY